MLEIKVNELNLVKNDSNSKSSSSLRTFKDYFANSVQNSLLPSLLDTIFSKNQGEYNDS